MFPADPDETRLKAGRAASSRELVRLIVNFAPSRGSDETADLFILGLIFLGLRMFSVVTLALREKGPDGAVDIGAWSDSSSLSPSDIVQHCIVRGDPREAFETPDRIESLCAMPVSTVSKLAAVPVPRAPAPSNTVG